MIKKAYFAGGCFWCITPEFKIDGVESVTSGFSGGDEVDPTYEEVKHQQTGHRETIEVVYDADQISFERLLEIFIANVDPYDGGGQFIDRGFSYTTAIYYGADPADVESERTAAQQAVGKLRVADDNGEMKEPQIAIEPFKAFYAAEEYHQDYYLKNPEAFERELEESGRKDRIIRL